MQKLHRRFFLLAAALIIGAAATTMRASAIESSNYTLDPISLFGSYGGGTTASTNYRVTISWTGVSGRIRASNANACVGFLCQLFLPPVYIPLTVK